MSPLPEFKNDRKIQITSIEGGDHGLLQEMVTYERFQL